MVKDHVQFENGRGQCGYNGLIRIERREVGKEESRGHVKKKLVFMKWHKES